MIEKRIGEHQLFSWPLLALLVCLFFNPTVLFAWPADSQWVPLVRQSDWSPLRDVTGDMSPYNADISSNGYYKNLTVGNMDSVFLFSDGTDLYIRYLLSDSPLTWFNSENTYRADQTSFVALIDTNGDNVSDYTATATKNNSLDIYTGTTLTQSVVFGTIPKPTSSLYPIVYLGSKGYIRVVDTGIRLYDRPGQPSAFTLHYLDLRVPRSWLPGLTQSTYMRTFFGTSNNDNNINKDYLIGNSLNFDQVAATSPGGMPRWGALFDTRDTAPSSSAGIWFGNETLSVTGFGWPSNRTLTVRIYSPDGAVQYWQGPVTTNSSGKFIATNIWKIPLNIGPGIYQIYVLDPYTNQPYRYDTFEIRSPYVSVAKTVTPEKTIPGDPVTYTIVLANSGNVAAAMTNLTDTLPDGFVYSAGSTTGMTTSNPQISGQNLLWLGSWTIPVNESLTLSFKAKTGKIAGAYKNQADVVGSNFGPYSSGPTAQVTIVTPALALSKAADKNIAAPGEEITYTISYRNQGGAVAQTLAIFDTVPNNTSYVVGSLRFGSATSTYATATPLTDSAGDDQAEFSGGNITFTVGPIAADDAVPGTGGDEGKCYFKVKIN